MMLSDKVQSSQEGKIKLQNAYKQAGLTIEKLADKACTSSDTIKRLLGTKDCPNGVERRIILKIAEVLKIKPTDIVDPKDWYPQQIPSEFERLIKDKTESFRGRKFVFDAIEEFFSKNSNGYFTVVGDAGMGKSAISAKYVLDNPEAICFFNVRAEGMNRPELFLKKIRQQLMNRYQLQDAADADLSSLLTKASEKITAGDRLIIVVDALDEVDHESTGNLLYLPTILPENVYFLLTRRPYNQNEKRLNVSPSVPTQELDLRDYPERSSQDVKEYIWLLLNDGEYKQGLSQWIEKQNLSNTEFVEEVATKSENNFMYLRCVLPAIAEGFYNNKPLDELPVGLQGYYENHWQLMGMTSKPLPKNKIKIVYVMCALRSAASREVIAKYSKQNELTVQEVLNGWAQFLQKQENNQSPRYRFYHESFRDFLHRQDIVQAAGVNLPDISAEVADNITGGLFGDE
ncbi:XRE family transcriptional regulator [Hassallia byssoidea VB512170]|uniref:XRE family transcriptional regulator n=1 Tax=Hassallia byssoidea VB512170 TaxID=1304833 RepID=A0A846H3Y7_9CYAN|nr:helix-turn-helix domain-containing protein [Hassalia byssoidea]NEU71334.1 XRE family transcriptional regulator [Hassalia byssoidea VB512170]